jgi:hypothetical protein
MTDEEALRELDRRGIAFERLDRVPGVRAPVRLAGKLHGVLIRSSLPPEERIDSPFEILDARLALTLDDFTALLEAHDVVELVHYTMYRPNVAASGSSPSNGADDHEASPKAVPPKALPSKAVPSKGAAVRESAAKGKDGALEKVNVEAKPAAEPKSASGSKPEKAEKAEKADKPEKTAKVEKTRKKGKKKKGEGKDGARSAAKIKGAKEKDRDGRVAKATRSTKASPKDAAKTGEGAGKSAQVAVAANERREASTAETAPRAVEPEVAVSKAVAPDGAVASSGAEPGASEGASTEAGSKATREDEPRKRRARHDKAVKGRRAAREAQAEKGETTEKTDAKGDKAEKTEKTDAKGDKAEKTEKTDAKGDKADKTSEASTRSWAPPGTRHPAGLAIDVGALRKSDGKWLHVADHFGGAIGAPTCGDRATPPSSNEGRELWSIVCESRDAGLFSYVLTPNYNAAHADHFHMEIKPGSRLVLYH